MSSFIVPFLVCAIVYAVGYWFGRLPLRRLQLENEILRAGRQAVANLEERAEDAKALEIERAELIRTAAELGERVRVLTAAGNVLYGEAGPYVKGNHAHETPLGAARQTWETVRAAKA